MSKKIEDYDVLSIVGTGSFGTCYKVRHKISKQIFVWKAVDYGKLTEEKKQVLVSEVNLLSKLHHPNIVQYYNRIVHRESTTLYIIMEWCQGGDLCVFIKNKRMENKLIDEPFIWKALYQISKALQVCHTRLPHMTLLHRDIKPANIFLDGKGNFKLGDFGLARSEEECNYSDNIVGTPYYMSPEIVKGRKYDRKSDIWALGCLIYELCSLIPPFRGTSLQNLVSNIKTGKYASIPEFYSKHLSIVISYMLSIKREYRPTVEMIIHHPLVVTNVKPEIQGNNITQQNKTTEVLEEKMSNEFDSISKGMVNISVSQKDPEEISETLFNERWLLRLENLREREAKLKEKEEMLLLKEESLINKEKYLSLLEKRTKERMTVAQVYLNRRKVKLSSSTENISDISADPGDTSICPTTAKLDPSVLPKPSFVRSAQSRRSVASKHVHFERRPLKENGVNGTSRQLSANQNQSNFLSDPKTHEIVWLANKRFSYNSSRLDLANKENTNFHKTGITKLKTDKYSAHTKTYLL